MAVRIYDWGIDTEAGAPTLSDVFRRFIPNESGTSIEDQIFPWSVDGLRRRMREAMPLHGADPMSVSNVIRMMAVEQQHWLDYQMMAKMTADANAKKMLTSIAQAEHIHHMKLMSLMPTTHDPSQATLRAELAILGLYSDCLSDEPNDSVRSAFQRIFNDHLQHAEFAAESVRSIDCPTCTVDMISGGVDLSGGTPIEKQFMKPDDTVWQGKSSGCYDKNRVDARTLVNVDMALAAELMAYDLYHCAMSQTSDGDMRTNLAAFQSIEGQHSAILGSIMDPTESFVERALTHEQVEVSQYRRLMDEESDSSAKDTFADLYKEDLEQARIFGRFAGPH